MEASKKLKGHRTEFLRQQKKGPLLSYSSLTDHDKLFMAQRVFKAIRSQPGRDQYQIFAENLFDWGIMCPHPEARREDRGGYHFCGGCGALVLDFGQLNSDDDVAKLVKEGAR